MSRSSSRRSAPTGWSRSTSTTSPPSRTPSAAGRCISRRAGCSRAGCARWAAGRPRRRRLARQRRHQARAALARDRARASGGTAALRLPWRSGAAAAWSRATSSPARSRAAAVFIVDDMISDGRHLPRAAAACRARGAAAVLRRGQPRPLSPRLRSAARQAMRSTRIVVTDSVPAAARTGSHEGRGRGAGGLPRPRGGSHRRRRAARRPQPAGRLSANASAAAR